MFEVIMVDYKQLFKLTNENMVNKKEIGDPVLGEFFSTPFKTNLQHFYHGQDTKVAVNLESMSQLHGSFSYCQAECFFDGVF